MGREGEGRCRWGFCLGSPARGQARWGRQGITMGVAGYEQWGKNQWAWAGGEGVGANHNNKGGGGGGEVQKVSEPKLGRRTGYIHTQVQMGKSKPGGGMARGGINKGGGIIKSRTGSGMKVSLLG